MPSASSTPELSKLIGEHYEMLYRFAYRLCGSAEEAEDLTQQTFLVAHQKLQQLREAERAKGWLFSILRNLFLKSVSRPGKNGSVPLDSVAELEYVWDADAVADQEALQQAISQLPEEYRVPIALFYLGEFSYKEIAQQLEVPIGTVMSRLSRGKSALRRRLASEFQDHANTNQKSIEASI
ncbi:MAG: RNA polymerase subunit sigma [Planctomycetaceae bacterium]|nr:RNA polymerase subunit sigma [Planctomycetaceae bacterium]